MVTRLTPLTALVAALLALTGCGGTPHAAAPPRPTLTISSPPHPPKRESPQHFIRRFISVSNAMERAGGTRDFLALTSHCHSCTRLAEQIRTARWAGGFYHSQGWKVLRIRPGVTGPSGAVDVDVVAAPTAFKMSATAAVQHYPGGHLMFQLNIRRSRTGWSVTNVEQVAS